MLEHRWSCGKAKIIDGDGYLTVIYSNIDFKNSGDAYLTLTVIYTNMDFQEFWCTDILV